MKHVFYVIYVLFYTGAVFVTGLFVGQMLERSWSTRRNRLDEMPPSSAAAIDPVAGSARDGREGAAATATKRS